jgi:hypothetical protein
MENVTLKPVAPDQAMASIHKDGLTIDGIAKAWFWAELPAMRSMPRTSIWGRHPIRWYWLAQPAFLRATFMTPVVGTKAVNQRLPGIVAPK